MYTYENIMKYGYPDIQHLNLSNLTRYVPDAKRAETEMPINAPVYKGVQDKNMYNPQVSQCCHLCTKCHGFDLIITEMLLQANPVRRPYSFVLATNNRWLFLRCIQCPMSSKRRTNTNDECHSAQQQIRL